MTTAEIISLIGILAGLALLMILIMKGINIFVISFLAATVVALTGGLNLYDALKTTFVGGFVTFFQSNYLIFLTGVLMGKAMEVTNGAKAIARLIVRIFGTRWALLSVPLSCTILAFGGVSTFVVGFAVFPIGLEVFREADVPRYYMPAAICFGSAAVYFPGAPLIHNAIVGEEFGVSLSAGATIGWISGIVVYIIGVVWLFALVRKSHKKGEHFVAKSMDTFNDDAKCPNGVVALVPLVAAVVLVNTSLVQLETGVLIGAVLAFVLFHNYYDLKDLLPSIGDACKNTIVSICNTCAVVAFGSVVSAAVGFQVVVDAMVSIPGPPLLGVAIGTTVLAGVCGSASGGLGIAAPLLGPVYLAQGIPAAAIARTMVVACTALDSLPHNGFVVTITNGLCNETHKDAYPAVFRLTVIVPFIGTLVAVILFTLFPNLP